MFYVLALIRDWAFNHLSLIFTRLQLDSATSLILAAKNLMNAVILTVKASYVASTKVRHKHA